VKWIVHGERVAYDSPWVRLVLADVEIPGSRRFEHHVVRMPREAAGVVVHVAGRGVLLLWRHRFVTDTWGWEIPAGGVEAGESTDRAAHREALEETGWEVSELAPLFAYHPMNGVSDQTFHVFLGTGATYKGDPSDPEESERIEWLSTERIRQAIRDGEVPDGFTLTALTYALSFGHLT